MSEQPDGGASQRRRPFPPHSKEERPAGNEQESNAIINLTGIQALERLRDRIRIAANEILRLREENAALAERIARLETRPGTDLEEGSFLHLDEDPEALRRKVTGFIEAIDQYLEREQPSGL